MCAAVGWTAWDLNGVAQNWDSCVLIARISDKKTAKVFLDFLESYYYLYLFPKWKVKM